MKASRWAIEVIGKTIARYRILNDGNCLNAKLGWAIIACAIAYTTLVVLLSFIAGAQIPLVSAFIIAAIMFWGLSFAGKLSIQRSAPTEECRQHGRWDWGFLFLMSLPPLLHGLLRLIPIINGNRFWE